MSKFERQLKQLFPNATDEALMEICELALRQMDAEPKIPE